MCKGKRSLSRRKDEPVTEAVSTPEIATMSKRNGPMDQGITAQLLASGTSWTSLWASSRMTPISAFSLFDPLRYTFDPSEKISRAF